MIYNTLCKPVCLTQSGRPVWLSIQAGWCPEILMSNLLFWLFGAGSSFQFLTLIRFLLPLRNPEGLAGPDWTYNCLLLLKLVVMAFQGICLLLFKQTRCSHFLSPEFSGCQACTTTVWSTIVINKQTPELWKAYPPFAMALFFLPCWYQACSYRQPLKLTV